MAEISIKDLLKSESQVLNEIAAELNSESNDRISAYHGSHSSGHSSRGGHNSSTAKVERPLRTNKK
jgi:hypothetical protein|tara:strand:+ start:567 stop:764 length:198 start_codon:yes stop_codon:yes gene_type:complete